MGWEEVNRRRRGAEGLEEWADREVEEQGRQVKIEKSRYFKEYVQIQTGNEYLGGDFSLEDKRALAGFPCGNWFRASEFWRGNEERACRICWMGVGR